MQLSCAVFSLSRLLQTTDPCRKLIGIIGHLPSLLSCPTEYRGKANNLGNGVPGNAVIAATSYGGLVREASQEPFISAAASDHWERMLWRAPRSDS